VEVGRGDDETGELQAVADQQERGHRLAEHPQSRIGLAGQGRPGGREAAARVLQQQPVDRQQLLAGNRSAVAPQPQLEQQLAPAARAEDAQRLARCAQIELDLRTRVAEIAQPGHMPETFERQLEP